MIPACKVFADYVKIAHSITPLGDNEKDLIIQKIKNGTETDSDRRRLADGFFWLTLGIAKTFVYSNPYRAKDILQEAISALLDACRRYKFQAGKKASSYIASMIRGRIHKLVTQGVVRLTSGGERLRIQNKITRPVVISIDAISQCEQTTIQFGDTAWYDTEVEDSLDDKKMSEMLSKELEQLLSSQDLSIVKLAYGLDGNDEHSMADIGRIFSRTRETIRQRLISIHKILEKSKVIQEARKELEY